MNDIAWLKQDFKKQIASVQKEPWYKQAESMWVSLAEQKVITNDMPMIATALVVSRIVTTTEDAVDESNPQ